MLNESVRSCLSLHGRHLHLLRLLSFGLLLRHFFELLGQLYTFLLFGLFPAIVVVLLKGLDVPVVLFQGLVDLPLDLSPHSDVHVQSVESAHCHEEGKDDGQDDQHLLSGELVGLHVAELCWSVALHLADSLLELATVDCLHLLVDEDSRVSAHLLPDEKLSLLQQIGVVIDFLSAAQK